MVAHHPVTPVADEPAPRRERVDIVAVAYGVGSFAAVMLFVFALWLVDFQVDATVQQVGAWGTVIVLIAWILLGTPSSRLHPKRRAIREQRRSAGILGAAFGVLLLGGYESVVLLDSWAEWVVLVNSVLGAIGLFFALHGDLLFRKR